MAKSLMPVSGEVIAWAIQEAGYSVEDLAERLQLEPEVVAGWVAGEKRPSKGELTKLARILRRPTAIFFLPKPPHRNSVPPRFRTAHGGIERQLRPEEMRQLRRARRVQRLVALLLREEGQSPPQIPRLTTADLPAAAAAQLRSWVGITSTQQLAWTTPAAAFNGWRGALEERGVLVFQLQLGTDGIRGFSVFDEWAPLVAVNTADNYAARTFTLVHELAHLATRTDRSCVLPMMRHPQGGSSTERWCEEVAAAFLLPADDVLRIRAELMRSARPPEDEFALARRLGEKFGASIRAAAIRLVELELADWSLYDEVEERAPVLDRQKGFGVGGGQPAPQRRLSELGSLTTSVLLDALDERRLNERDLRDYLRLDGDELQDLRGQLRSLV